MRQRATSQPKVSFGKIISLIKEACQNRSNYIRLATVPLSFAELYAGKICAALDRQHPRDLFDIKLLLENEGITSEMRKVFIVYLASSPRPMSEIFTASHLQIKPV